MRGKWLLATALSLVCAAGARADTLDLLRSTFNPPAPAGTNVNQITNTSLGGFSFTNANVTGGGTVGPGTQIKEIGYDFPVGLQNVGGPLGSTGLTNGLYVFAVQGTVLSGNGTTGTLVANITTGTLRLFNNAVNAATFSASDPGTWIQPGATLVETWTVHSVPGGTDVISDPATGPGKSQPAASNNQGIANLASPFNSDTNVTFDNRTGPAAYEPQPGLFVDLGERLTNPFAFNSANADALALLITAGQPGGAQGFLFPGDTFSPGYSISGNVFSGSAANGDTIQAAGATAWFGPFLTSSPPGTNIPEIDPSSIVGALTLLGGGLMYLREKRFRNKK